LNDLDREKILKPLMESGWSIVKDRDALYKEYKFENFIQVITFYFSKSCSSSQGP
jgi:4a-hydroxytetrahydrobiopterin dehydratase